MQSSASLIFKYVVLFIIFYRVVGSVRVAQKNHCDGSIVIFDGCWIKTVLYRLARVLQSWIWKDMACPLFILNGMFMFGYYNEFTFVRRQIPCQFVFDHWVNHYIYHMINQRSMIMTLNIFSILDFKFGFTEALLKRIVMVFTPPRKKHGREISYIYKNKRCNTVNSNVNISKSNNFNTSNSDNVIGN